METFLRPTPIGISFDSRAWRCLWLGIQDLRQHRRRASPAPRPGHRSARVSFFSARVYLAYMPNVSVFTPDELPVYAKYNRSTPAEVLGN